MRTWKTKLGTMLLAGGLAGWASGAQTPEVVKQVEEQLKSLREKASVDVDKLLAGKLEEQIAAALRNNPEIQVAEAKAREAQMDVQRARVQVVNKISRTRTELDAARSDIEVAEAGLRRMKQLVERGTTSVTELQAAEALLLKARAAYEMKQQELMSVIGVSKYLALDPSATRFNPFGGSTTPYSVPLNAPKNPGKLVDKVAPAMLKKLEKELAKTVDITGTELKVLEPQIVAESIFESKLPIRTLLRSAEYKPLKIGELKGVSMLDVLMMMEDECGVEFHVREYGLLLVDADSPPNDPLTLRGLMRELRQEKASGK